MAPYKQRAQLSVDSDAAFRLDWFGPGEGEWKNYSLVGYLSQEEIRTVLIGVL
jgi:hypothetical protein